MKQNDGAVDGRIGEQYYLPAMPTLTEDGGRIERFFASLLRRRGGVRVRLKR